MTSWQCLEKYKKTNDNTDCITEFPAYASSLIFELYKDTETNKYYVKLKYNGVD
jgi:hypothetical protein